MLGLCRFVVEGLRFQGLLLKVDHTCGGARKSGMISISAVVDSGFEVSVFRA